MAYPRRFKDQAVRFGTTDELGQQRPEGKRHGAARASATKFFNGDLVVVGIDKGMVNRNRAKLVDQNRPVLSLITLLDQIRDRSRFT